MGSSSNEQPGDTPGNAASGRSIRASGSDLFDHLGLVVLLVAFGLAATYTLVDAFFLLNYAGIGTMPIWPFFVVAAITAPLALLIGRRAPQLERYAMASLVSVAVIWAVYPAMLRINALTGRAEVVVYRPTGIGQFKDPSGSHPPIDLKGRYDGSYWKQHGTEHPHRFRLIEGGLGFYQLDLGPLYARMGRLRRQMPRP